MRIFSLLAVFLLLGIFPACDSSQKTIDQLRQEIADYPLAPTPVAEARISQGFADLDAEIARLQAHGRSSDAAALQGVRNELQGQYDTARVTATLRKTTEAVQQLGETVRQAGQQLGEIFRSPSSPSASQTNEE